METRSANAGRPFFLRFPVNVAREVEKRARYRFGDKERERSNHAAQLAAGGVVIARCPLRHDQVAYSGPPHDAIRAWVCLRCNAAACEPEIKDRGQDFDTVTDYLLEEILDLDLKRQNEGRLVSYPR